MKKQSKLLIGIIAVVAVLAVVIISIVMTAAGGSKDTYNSHMELAQRYLDELQYEQAIAEYEAALEIEPHNSEAYLGLAEVYVAMDDIEKALDVLAEGYTQIQSDRIAKRQEELAVAQLSSAEMENTNEFEAAGQTEPQVVFVPWSEADLEDREEQSSEAEDEQTGEMEDNSMSQDNTTLNGLAIVINDYELFTDGFYYEWSNGDGSYSFVDFTKGGISGHFIFSRELTDEEENWYHGGKLLNASGEDSNIDVRFFATDGVFAAEFSEQLPKGNYIYVLTLYINNEHCEARIPFTIN